MKKKIVTAMLAASMLVAFAGCGGSATETGSDDGQSEESEETETDDAAGADTEKAADTEEVAGVDAAEGTEAGSTEAGGSVEGEVIVFAAASMTETLTEVGDNFMAANPEVTITYNFDSSGTLKTQIEEGADCDLFISAGQTQMNQLDINADPEVNESGLDFVDPDSRRDILENKVTLCVADNDTLGIDSFDALAEALKGDTDILMAMGNSDVPVGQYTQKILEYYGIDEAAIADKLSYGSNVKEVTTQVTEGSVNCGVVYCTDAYSAGLTPVDYATEEMCGQVIYPASVLKTALNPEAAQAFLDYCFTDESMAIFEAVGFSPVE